MLNGIWKEGLTDPLSIPDDILNARIAETAIWCDLILHDSNTKPSMRSNDLQFRLLHEGRDNVVCDIGAARHWRVYERYSVQSTKLPDLFGGRLMIYYPNADLCDGAAEIVSEGFFDGFNTPPWDTWVSYFEDQSVSQNGYDVYLLAFVPREFLSQADAGILVNPEACIVWLADANVSLTDRLAKLGS